MPRGKNITDIILTWCCTSEFAGQFKVIGSHSSSMDLKKKKKKDAQLDEESTCSVV